jgi:hypothetical protein
MTPFRARPFLFRMLGGVFLAEFILLGYSLHRCATVAPGKVAMSLQARCPSIGDRAQEMFTLSTATVLSLLTDTTHTQ